MQSYCLWINKRKQYVTVIATSIFQKRSQNIFHIALIIYTSIRSTLKIGKCMWPHFRTSNKNLLSRKSCADSCISFPRRLKIKAFPTEYQNLSCSVHPKFGSIHDGSCWILKRFLLPPYMTISIFSLLFQSVQHVTRNFRYNFHPTPTLSQTAKHAVLLYYIATPQNVPKPLE